MLPLSSSIVVEIWGIQPAEYRDTPNSRACANMRIGIGTFAVAQYYAWVNKPCISRVSIHAGETPHKPGIAWGVLKGQILYPA